MADEAHKQTLISELEAARTHLGGYVGALRHDLNVGARLKTGMARNPAAWFAGAAGLGLLLARLAPSRRKVVLREPAVGKGHAETAGKAAFVLTALKFAMDFAKPALVSWVKKQVGARAAARPASAG